CPRWCWSLVGRASTDLGRSCKEASQTYEKRGETSDRQTHLAIGKRKSMRSWLQAQPRTFCGARRLDATGGHVNNCSISLQQLEPICYNFVNRNHAHQCV